MTAADQAIAKAGLDAYLAFWRVTDEARITPGLKDWSADVGAVATPDRTSPIIDHLNLLISDQQHQVNSRVVTGQVEYVSQDSVTILGCVDSSKVYVVDVSGNSVTKPEAQGAASQTVVVRLRPGGSWKAAQFTNPKVPQPC